MDYTDGYVPGDTNVEQVVTSAMRAAEDAAIEHRIHLIIVAYNYTADPAESTIQTLGYQEDAVVAMDLIRMAQTVASDAGIDVQLVRPQDN